MKTNLYLSVAFLAILFLVSCNKETLEPTSQPGEKNARLELTLAGTKAVSGRATDSALPTSEGNIKTIAVGVFNNDGSVNVIAEPTVVQSGEALTAINCTPGTVSIIVVANAPAGTFAGMQNKTDFITKTVALSATQDGDIQKSDNLPMSGEAASVVLTAGQSKAETIELSRLVARVSISSIKTAFDANGAYKNATFTPKKVFLYNAMSTSTVIPTSQPTGSNPIHGATALGGVYAAGMAWLLDDVIGSANTDYTTPHWFYTFANDGTSTPTKFVIAGEFDIDGIGASPAETVYYPIVVNKAQNGTTISGTGNGDSTIKRNSEYKLSAIIKGKGVNDPSIDIDPATLTLTVNVAAWELTITQEVTFE